MGNIAERRETCPVCKNDSLIIRLAEYYIPYFGRVALISERCEKCGYVYNDVYCLEIKNAQRYEYKISSPEDLSVRVVRSRYGKIELPELGVEITPGPIAEAFISNIEGVLERVAYILEDFLLWDESPEVKNRAKRLLDLVEKVKRGEQAVTLIIEDPTGNSAIIPPPHLRAKLKVVLPESSDSESRSH
ncbi:MAG: hypothetical protein DRJ52_07280 [Thermoprotei archaeon]|nr:MAG: hypothetical protein DRJ52_07280 [Thermoprotei archaeon]RLF00592.1 MAG: hypothetical protein DRJ63_02100 [Thermoprotei archaeon]HDI74345.1 ZPR1 zinc finger domain-containing protein [Thermoprotei archaeon]